MIIAMTQPEQVLEDELVAQLMAHGYPRAAVTDEASMLANLKAQLEAFNQRCLLYTSPSPRDRTRSRMPSSA